jgi:arylsulfatase A-like enzyme
LPESVPAHAPLARPLALGLIGAAGVGLCDGMASVVSDILPLDIGRSLALLGLDAVTIGAVVLAPLLVLLMAVGPRRTGGLGLVWGAGLGVLLVWGERWFTQPPPHTVVDPLHGALWVYGLGAAGILGGAWLLRGRAAWLASAVLACGLGCWLAVPRSLPARGMPAEGAPDVLLITIDTLRADHIGAYGSEGVWTPNIDALADEGARFARASAQIAVTGPSHLTMMSGQGPWSHGVLLNGMAVPSEAELLAETMRSAGYHTGAFVSAYVLDGRHGFAQGFAVYDDDFGWLQGWSDTAGGRIAAWVRRKLDPVHVLERSGEQTVAQALAWRDSVDDGPVFMWVHLFDPHGPYTPPSPWDTAYYEGDPRSEEHSSMAEVSGVPDYMLPSMAGITDVAWVRAQYAGEVSAVDAVVGELLESLPGADEAVVMLLGDHGESLGDNGVWFHHGGDLRGPELDTPMVLRYPARVPAGSVVAGPVELTDVAATLSELVGIAAPADNEGLSLVESTQTGISPRDWSRGLCLDRPANLKARAAGEIDRPRYRVGTVRGPVTQLISRDSPGSSVERLEHRQGAEVNVPISILGDPPTPQIERMLTAVQALVASGMDSADQRDEQTLQKLRALGYIE